MATTKDDQLERVRRQLGGTAAAGPLPPPPAPVLTIAPRALDQRNPQLAATSGVAGAVPPRAARLIPASVGGAPVQAAAKQPDMPYGGGTLSLIGELARGIERSIPTAPMAQGRVGVGSAPAATQAAAPPMIAQPPAAAGPVRSPLDKPGFAPAAPAAPAQDTTMLGPVKRAQQPGEAGRSVSGRQLPGAPTVGADGSIVYDQAFMDRNKPLIAQYQQQNVVPTVVPPPGVAASTATGGNMPSGPLTRAPAGFTAADRAAQLDALDRLGRSNAETKVRDAMGKAAARGDAAAVAQLAGATSALASPPLEPMRRGMAESGARLGMDQARLAMDQNKAQLDAEAKGVDTRARGLQLKQAEQMQALTQQLLQGTPEEKQAAAQSLAAMQGTKPGQPIKVKQQVDTGRIGLDQNPIMADVEVLYDPNTGQWLQPPTQQSAAVPDAAIQHLKQNDSPQMREAFKAKYGVDPSQYLG